MWTARSPEAPSSFSSCDSVRSCDFWFATALSASYHHESSENSEAFKNEKKKNRCEEHFLSCHGPHGFFFFLVYPNYFCSNWIAFVMKIRLFSAFMSVGNESGESCRLCEILACIM